MRIVRDATWGAAVTVVLSMLPFSPVLGGATAASRSDRSYLGGLGVGVLSGGLAAVPLLALFVPTLLIAGWLGFGMAPSAPAYDVFLAIVFGLFGVYTIGLSAIGGLSGVWIDRHTEWDLDPSRWL